MRFWVNGRGRPRVGTLVLGLLLAGGALQPDAYGAPVPDPSEPPSTGGTAPAACLPSGHHPEVIKIVQRVGIGYHVSSKVMLAAFEAGWVESHMNNLPCGDLDSVGVFQQRPGWGSESERTYVVYAAKAFFAGTSAAEGAPGYNKGAIQAERDCPTCTAGQIAQDVQGSAFPDRYDQAEAKARDLMAEATRLYNDEQHVVAQTAAGSVYHTLRDSGGWTRAGNVEGQSGPISTAVTDVAGVQVNGELHVLAVAGGQLHHTIRHSPTVMLANPGWTDWGNVEGQTGSIGGITSVAGAEVNGTLHVVATTESGVFHAVRGRLSGWTRFGNVEGQAGSIVTPTEVAAAGMGANLHVLVVSRDGVLRHTLRTPDDWTTWGNVEGQTGNVGLINDVAAATIGSGLHVVATNTAGGVFHAVRGSSGWTGFGDVEGQSGSIGTAWFSGATGRSNGELHVLATNSAGTPYHAIRRSSGWTNWGNIDGQVNYPDEIHEIDAG